MQGSHRTHKNGTRAAISCSHSTHTRVDKRFCVAVIYSHSEIYFFQQDQFQIVHLDLKTPLHLLSRSFLACESYETYTNTITFVTHRNYRKKINSFFFLTFLGVTQSHTGNLKTADWLWLKQRHEGAAKHSNGTFIWVHFMLVSTRNLLFSCPQYWVWPLTASTQVFYDWKWW